MIFNIISDEPSIADDGRWTWMDKGSTPSCEYMEPNLMKKLSRFRRKYMQNRGLKSRAYITEPTAQWPS